MSDLVEAAVRLDPSRLRDMVGVFARQRDAWVGHPEADVFAELVGVLLDAEAEATRRHRDIEDEFLRVIGIVAGPGGILNDSRVGAGYPPDSAGWQSAQDARGYPVPSDDAPTTLEES